MKIKINGRNIGPQFPPFVIAEMSANHNGTLKRALETIDAAQRSGADAVKLQTYTADTMTIDCDHPDFMISGGLWDGYKLYDLYKWAETPYEWHQTMFDYARKRGVTLFSTPFDETAIDLLESLNAPAYKIASFELVDIPLIRYAASTGKPMIMSTGMASDDEIEEAVTAAREAGCKDIVLLHCVSSYPAPVDQTNLLQIPELARRFDVLSGLSDHTMSTAVSVAAVALGACVIEKHFTLSRSDKGPDSEFSIEPEELARLCTDARDAWTAIGKESLKHNDTGNRNKIFRRSLYFVSDLPAGAVITAKDIRRIRPGKGLAPKFYDKVVGQRLSVGVCKGQAVQLDLLKNE